MRKILAALTAIPLLAVMFAAPAHAAEHIHYQGQIECPVGGHDIWVDGDRYVRADGRYWGSVTVTDRTTGTERTFLVRRMRHGVGSDGVNHDTGWKDVYISQFGGAWRLRGHIDVRYGFDLDTPGSADTFRADHVRDLCAGLG
jgi:hypothetical protein